MPAKKCTACGVRKNSRSFDAIGAFQHTDHRCKECVRLSSLGDRIRKAANDEPIDPATKKAWATLRKQTDSAKNGGAAS